MELQGDRSISLDVHGILEMDAINSRPGLKRSPLQTSHSALKKTNLSCSSCMATGSHISPVLTTWICRTTGKTRSSSRLSNLRWKYQALTWYRSLRAVGILLSEM